MINAKGFVHGIPITEKLFEWIRSKHFLDEILQKSALVYRCFLYNRGEFSGRIYL